MSLGLQAVKPHFKYASYEISEQQDYREIPYVNGLNIIRLILIQNNH